MEITGKILQINEAQTGQSARGEWKKQEIIIETQEQYPRKVCLLNWNDKVDINSVKIGETITAGINIESREFKGRWFTDIKIWKIDSGDNNTQAPPPAHNNDEQPNTSIDPFADESGEGDDLPF